MKNIYIKSLLLAAPVAIVLSACGQDTKVKTITIVNGDTTISEKIIGDKEIAEIDKQITMIVTSDSVNGKKMIKKIVVKGDDKDAASFAYAISKTNDAEIEVDATDKSATTKIVITSDDDSKGDKKTIKKTIVKEEKENVNLSINVKKNVAKVDFSTNSKEPINVSVLDENGKQIFYDSQKTGNAYSKEIKLDKKGHYFLTIVQNKKITTEKIIVE